VIQHLDCTTVKTSALQLSLIQRKNQWIRIFDWQLSKTKRTGSDQCWVVLSFLVFTLIFTGPKTFTWGRVSVCNKYFHWPCASVKKEIYTAIG
jgi:hypothetical protein